MSTGTDIFKIDSRTDNTFEISEAGKERGKRLEGEERK